MNPFQPVVVLLLASAACRVALAAEATQETTVLEEILVTGTLREQRLEDVPASVTVLDARTLGDAGQQHFQDVLALVPNLNWAGGSSRPRYFQIRGIGEREQYEGAPNPSVGFLIDDIDFSGIGMPATLFDVGQIEVLRGPQGTRHGANALAGLIVVRGSEPEKEPGWSLQATGGDYGTRSLGLAATGPVPALDSAWRLSVQQSQGDGFMRNDYLGRNDTNGRDELTARLKWRWSRDEDTSLDFTYLHADIDNRYDAWALDNSRISLADEPGRDSQRANGASLRLSRALRSGNMLTAIGSLADSRSVNSYDADWGNDESWAPYLYRYFGRYARERRSGSLELRLASPGAGVATPAWLIGAYALRLRESGSDDLSGAYADPGDAPYESLDALDHRYRATNLALFGQLDGQLAERWLWSAGLRLEQRQAHYADEGVVAEVTRQSDMSSRDRMLGGQLSLSTDLSSAATFYAALSRGYKAGGFNPGVVAGDAAQADAARRFDPEYLWNLETGVKALLPGGRGRADLILFHQWRKDQQERTGFQLDPSNPNSYVFLTSNIPKGRTSGLEASLQYELAPALSVGASLGLLRSRSGAATMVDEAGNEVVIPSRELAHAPTYTAAIHASLRAPGGFMARVDLTAMDAFYFDVPTDHDQRSRAYALVHLKLGYEAQRWRIHGWLRNAFDRRYAVRGFYFSNEPPDWPQKRYVQLGDPRQFGLTASVDFRPR